MKYKMEQKWNTIQHGTEIEMDMVQKYNTKSVKIKLAAAGGENFNVSVPG